MRFRLVIIIALFFLNCEDKQTSKQTNTSKQKDTIVEKPKEITKKKTEPEFPVLTDNNAMEFFLE